MDELARSIGSGIDNSRDRFVRTASAEVCAGDGRISTSFPAILGRWLQILVPTWCASCVSSCYVGPSHK